LKQVPNTQDDTSSQLQFPNATTMPFTGDSFYFQEKHHQKWLRYICELYTSGDDLEQSITKELFSYRAIPEERLELSTSQNDMKSRSNLPKIVVEVRHTSSTIRHGLSEAAAGISTLNDKSLMVSQGRSQLNADSIPKQSHRIGLSLPQRMTIQDF